MEGVLTGVRVVEGAAYIAAPIAGMTLAQMGADVIRVDPLGGGPDRHRWPLTAEGRSLYWAGLNKGKRSIAVDLRSETGRELVAGLIAEAGAYLTNVDYPGLDYPSLRVRRADLIMLELTGDREGRAAFDYTVNAAVGYPAVTGPVESEAPVNHVLPAWDVLAGAHAVSALLAAELHRRYVGGGQLIRLALFDVALATVGHLGHIAEAQINGAERGRYGNFIYGTFGCDFETADGRRVMVAALTRRQWESLCAATGLGEGLNDLRDEGDRFRAREQIAAALRPWFRARTLAEVGDVLDRARVPWGPYQTFLELVAGDPRCSTRNPMLAEVEHPGIGTCLTPGSPLEFSGVPRVPPGAAPELGEHTDELLSDVLGLSDLEVGRLHDQGIVEGAKERV